eukprot:2475285-Amphidinium_carterae.1
MEQSFGGLRGFYGAGGGPKGNVKHFKYDYWHKLQHHHTMTTALRFEPLANDRKMHLCMHAMVLGPKFVNNNDIKLWHAHGDFLAK